MTFLGIQFSHLPGGEIEMQQTGLIERVLNVTGLNDCNPGRPPASQKPCCLTEFRQPIQVQKHLEMPRILVQLGRIQ